MNGVQENGLIAALAPEDRALLEQLATRVPLTAHAVLLSADEESASIYFPLSGLLSHTAAAPGGDAIEIGLIGRDGAAPIDALFLGTRSLGEIAVQMEGEALRVPLGALGDALAARPAIGDALGRFAAGYNAAIARTALCNARHSVEARLARWLLCARDASDSRSKLPLTHEFLSQMLGVRRASVTVAAQHLREAGAIAYGFREITVVPNGLLERHACSCYPYVRDLLAAS